MTADAEEIYARADLMIVVGSRLRGNETKNNRMVLPPRVQIDADPLQCGRNYPVEQFIWGDARLCLEGLLERLPKVLDTDAQFLADIEIAHSQSEAVLRQTLGPYAGLADSLSRRIHDGGHPWVRDVTISNSTFGNRYVRIAAPNLGVHALGGGIGQGIAMAIGAALAGKDAKTIALIGDGGAQLMLGEFATAVEMQSNVVFVLMNDAGYGVIRNIQDAQYGGRKVYSNIFTPDFSYLCKAFGLPHHRVERIEDVDAALDNAIALRGPCVVEIDMITIGPFSQSFAGPPAGAAGSAR